MTLRSIIKASLYRGYQLYVAECLEVPVVTQGSTMDETIENLKEAVALDLEGENLAELGFTEHPVVLVTMELEPAVA